MRNCFCRARRARRTGACRARGGAGVTNRSATGDARTWQGVLLKQGCRGLLEQHQEGDTRNPQGNQKPTSAHDTHPLSWQVCIFYADVYLCSCFVTKVNIEWPPMKTRVLCTLYPIQRMSWFRYKLVDCPTQLICTWIFIVFHDKAKRTQQGNLLGTSTSIFF